jgi:hypothetical protein
MNRPTTTLSKYRWSWLSVMLAALAVMAAAQTSGTVKSSSQPVAKTHGSAKASSQAKAPPSPAQGGTNGPMDPGNASMSAPPGWVPPNHNAPQVQNQQSSKTGSKANAKKGKVASGAKK